MAEQENIATWLTDHLASRKVWRSLRGLRNHFLRYGVVRIPRFAPTEVHRWLAHEINHLAREHGRRRDLTIADTGGTPRKMRCVRRDSIRASVPRLYHASTLRTALGEIAGEEVLECPYGPEQYVITELSDPGDTHGWHWDDYSFALVWIIDCPPVEDGGFVQYVPHTNWDKADPRLHAQFVENPIYSMGLKPGDVYLMRTNTTLHRAYPISTGRRLVLNMAFAARNDLSRDLGHETADQLLS